jgi:hypothetical protein
MAPRQVPVPLRAARQGTQHSGTKLLSQPRHLIMIESRFMLRCRPLSISDTAPGSANLLGTHNLWARVRAMRLLIPAAAHDDAWPPPCRAREADTAHLAVANGPAATAAAWVRLV